MTRIWYLAMGLLFAGWLVALLYGQPEHLGTLHCAEGRDPFWINVWGHLEGRTTEELLPTWVCPEKYYSMNSK